MRQYLVSLLLVWLVAPPHAHAGSETPPPGAPWVQDLLVAQKKALEEGKPILLYFTKTY